MQQITKCFHRNGERGKKLISKNEVIFKEDNISTYCLRIGFDSLTEEVSF